MIGAGVQGMAELRKNLGKLMPKEAHAAARRALTRIAAKIRDDIRARAPVDTGTLRKAIRSRRARGDRETAVAEVRITRGKGATNDAWYWHFLEFGTVTQAARPFITPAIEQARATLSRELGEQLIREVAAALRKKAQAAAPAREATDVLGSAVAGSGPVGVGGR